MTRAMITIDGSQGEGGGQIVRSALAMAICTGQPCSLHAIRQGRRKPGLMRQHLTAVRAAAEVCRGTVTGAALGARALAFTPGPPRGGEYHFAVGTAGSTTLVLQTVLPALLIAEGPSVVRLEGGTHNPFAPPFDFLDRTFLPLLRRMGASVDAEIERAGFYPAGGGSLVVRVTPQPLRPLELLDRGGLIAVRGRATVAHLPIAIAQRELNVLGRKLAPWSPQLRQHEEPLSAGPGNVVHVEIESEHVTEVCTGFGQKGRAAERVAHAAAQEARAYLGSQAAVGPHLADQLLVPMVLAGGGEFSCVAPTEHSRTNAAVLAAFTGATIDFAENGAGRWRTTVRADALGP